VIDRHHYPDPRPPEPEAERAAVQGEFGGLGFNMAGHTWYEEGWGYDLFPDRESLTQRFEDFFRIIRRAAAEHGLSASVYTQTTDIESENNGLMTYDREIAKIEPQAVAMAHRGYFAPRVAGHAPIFVASAAVELLAPTPGAVIHYTTDGSEPGNDSPTYTQPLQISEAVTIKARTYWDDGTASRVSTFEFEKAMPRRSVTVEDLQPGLLVEHYEQDGSWRELPEFGTLAAEGNEITDRIHHAIGGREENYGLQFRGYISVPQTGVYGFHLSSDDGSRLYLAGDVIVENDGIHGTRERSGYVALEAGTHPIEIHFFQGAGGVSLRLAIECPGLEKQDVPGRLLFHAARR
jgi:hypothetical protein